MQAFLEPLTELAEYQQLMQERGKGVGILQITGCVNSQKTHLAYAESSLFPVRKRQNRRMKNTGFWRKMSICIRRRICSFIMQISKERF